MHRNNSKNKNEIPSTSSNSSTLNSKLENNNSQILQKYKLLNAEQWLELNEQIKRINLQNNDNKKYFEEVKSREKCPETIKVLPILHKTNQLPPTCNKVKQIFFCPKQTKQNCCPPSPISTSAYGTGGGTTTEDTGQESPSAEIQHQGREKPKQVKSVRYASDKPPINSSQSTLINAAKPHFYTSADRLAETLATQQRILRQELTLENKQGITQSEQNTKTETKKIKQKQPIMEMPIIKNPFIRTTKLVNNSTCSTPQLNSQIKHLNTNENKTLINNEILQIKPTNSHQLISTKSSSNENNASTFSQSFAQQLPKQNTVRQETQNKVPLTKKTTRKSKSPTKFTRKMSKSPRKSKSPKAKQQELEWVIKRRPDGTRYVTRRPMRSSNNSAIIKERRERSALRERHQSSALSTTTDDDGQNTMRQMIKEQRRRRKGHTKTFGNQQQQIDSNHKQQPNKFNIPKNSLPINQFQQQKQLQLDSKTIKQMLINRPIASFFTSTTV
ncbi:unnamed protein product [Meloidogyne enterolobii]|uniref:Uncharacterized protein n=2 Tax=Meloidogyne enterolobii TaxID=390850 RepID=A0ACB1AZC8_MELEN